MYSSVDLWEGDLNKKKYLQGMWIKYLDSQRYLFSPSKDIKFLHNNFLVKKFPSNRKKTISIVKIVSDKLLFFTFS